MPGCLERDASIDELGRVTGVGGRHVDTADHLPRGDVTIVDPSLSHAVAPWTGGR